MHNFASFNQGLTPAAESLIRAASSGALYGNGIFTTVAIRETKPIFWEKHWHRLMANAETVGLDISEFSEEATRDSLNEIVHSRFVILKNCGHVPAEEKSELVSELVTEFCHDPKGRIEARDAEEMRIEA